MKTNRNITRIVEIYLDGGLNKKELEQFEKELQVNKELKEELDLHRDVNVAISQDKVMDLREKLRIVYREIMQPVFKISWYHVAAASIAVLVGLSILFFGREDYSNQELYAQYFEPYPATMNIRSGNTEFDLILKEAIIEYDAKNYEEALFLLEKILKKDKNNLLTNFYSGISYLEIEKYKKANNSFNIIINHGDNLFIEHAAWYLGFCYLMTNDLLKATEHFSVIASSNSYYKTEAAAILKHIGE